MFSQSQRTGARMLTSDSEVVRLFHLFAEYGVSGVREFGNQIGRNEILSFIGFAILGFLGYHITSDGFFSGVITFGSMAQCLGLVLLIMKIHYCNNADGLSVETFVLYIAVYCLRLSATLFHDGYLPDDSTGDWVYQALDIVSCILVIYLLFVSTVSLPREKRAKTLNMMLFVIIPTIVSLILGVCIQSGLNAGSCEWADVRWAASVYLEIFVMIPQIFLMVKRARQRKCGSLNDDCTADGLTSHYIACTFVYRFANFYFWYSVMEELRCPWSFSMIPAYFIVGALALQVLILAEFMYYYVKAHVAQERLALPCWDL